MSHLSDPSRASQILLPFAEKEWISVPRACSILSVAPTTFYRLRKLRGPDGKPLLETLDMGRGMHRVKYASLVAFCDRIRERYAIPDRRPKLDHPMFRHRDEDLLPFPARDIMGTTEALTYLPFVNDAAVLSRIEEGCFEAYRLADAPLWRWRISRPSFAAWLSAYFPERQ